MHDDPNRPVARGRRVAIRRFTRADVDEWSAWPDHEDPLFRDYNTPRMSPRERDLWYAERSARPDHAMYAIVDANDRLVGRLFLRQIDQAKRSAVLGIDLRSDRLNEGMGTDALRAFTGYYFATMGADVLKLDVAAYNYRAQKVYERLGWVYVGERWNTYPSVFMPNVFTDPRLEAVRKYFRPGPGSVSVLHYDMELTRERWEEMNRVADQD